MSYFHYFPTNMQRDALIRIYMQRDALIRIYMQRDDLAFC